MSFIVIAKEKKQIPIPKGSLCFTYCQVPVVYTIADNYGLTIHYKDGSTKAAENLCLDAASSQHVFNRAGQVTQINVNIKKSHLK